MLLSEMIQNLVERINRYKTTIKEYAGSTTLVGMGALNTLHGSMHVIQAMQSFYLASNSLVEHSHEGHTGGGLMHIVEESMHNPYVGLAFAATGVLAISLGIRDKKHHKILHQQLENYEKQLSNAKEKIIDLESQLGINRESPSP